MLFDDTPVVEGGWGALFFVISVRPGDGRDEIEGIATKTINEETGDLTHLELYLTDDEMENIIAAYRAKKGA